MAQEVYEYSLMSLKQSMETAQEDWEAWQETLDAFCAFVGDDGIIRAKGSGLVTQVSCEEGDILREGATLLSWVEEGDCLLSVDVSEEDISAIETGDDVIVVFAAWPEDTYEGCVWEVSV